MSKRLTAAGYDPTNIEERARVIAKARGLVGDTRKRDVEEMEEDDEDAWEGEGDESMEVDGDDSRTAKRAKSTIVPKGKRIPGTDRQTAGLGSTQEAAKAVKLRALYQRGPNRLAYVLPLRHLLSSLLTHNAGRVERQIVTSAQRCPNTFSPGSVGTERRTVASLDFVFSPRSPRSPFALSSSPCQYTVTQPHLQLPFFAAYCSSIHQLGKISSGLDSCI